MTKQKNKKSDNDYLYWGIGFGSIVGMVLTVTFKQPTYFAIGLVMGIAIGTALDQGNKRKG